MVGSLVLRLRFDPVLIRGLSRTLRLRPTVFRADLLRARPPPDSSKGSHLLPTRPARRPAPYASDTFPGVTPPSGPRLISVCIQPSPWARRSVGVAEHGGSRFLRPDPSPGSGRDAGVPVRSPRRTSAPRAKLPLSIHVRSGPFSSCCAALLAVAPLVMGPGRLPLGQGLDFFVSPVPSSPPGATVGPASPIFTPRCPFLLSTARRLLNQP